MTSIYHLAMSAEDVSELAGKLDVMGKWRKRIANSVLGSNIDDLCLAWYEAGREEGRYEGAYEATEDIVTDLLSDAMLSLDLDVEIMQRIIDIVEH